MQRTREDWIGAGLRTLASSGIEGVKVEALAKELHISKGSFYHYWSDRAEFLEALLVDWEVHGTRRIIDELEKITSPHERFRRLFESTFSGDKRLEAAVHHWANVDASVAQRVARTEDMRKAYTTKILCDMGKPFTQAREIARIYYLICLGWIDWSQRNEYPASEIADLYQTLMTYVS
ncbi:TetR/AcrR family transcriptional regulator [Ktedonobacter robiniae]|uniref:HTH tetR-type domain-containing protein n=1 Tax=Ktedonobacter robiniae TaxID=2778365 RepID=A0ABQ3UP95_9CHLR|nr:TetR/AcrR family transcriptional regulator [Ktedonobacter robiniae]GHO54589.1 hypothetical protein KSB_30640 [Ktedonobacter robiniae]